MFNARFEIIGAKKIDETRQKPCIEKSNRRFCLIAFRNIRTKRRCLYENEYVAYAPKPATQAWAAPGWESLDSAGAGRALWA